MVPSNDMHCQFFVGRAFVKSSLTAGIKETRRQQIRTQGDTWNLLSVNHTSEKEC